MVAKIAARMKVLLFGNLTALVLGGAALTTAAPAQAQWGYGPRPYGRYYGRPYGPPPYRPYYGRPYGPRYGYRPYYGPGCRVVVTRRINRFGEPVLVRRRICG
jgi:hypothetical protein